ncbi:MAG: DUF2281 domain-containing protein [Fibrobacter sp.]|nr:DUF2281 domain-containing protein [Fibrobacter sp.]
MSTDVLGYISVRKEATLSYDSIVAEIKALPTEARWNLLMMLVSSLQPSEKVTPRKEIVKRKLGGHEAGFSMAPDFDETPDCFKEYL